MLNCFDYELQKMYSFEVNVKVLICVLDVQILRNIEPLRYQF